MFVLDFQNTLYLLASLSFEDILSRNKINILTVRCKIENITFGWYALACLQKQFSLFQFFFNPIALRKAKIVYNFGLSECNRVKVFVVGIKP